jgi:hypothetical protein
MYFDFGKFSFFIVFFEKVQFLEQKNLFFHIFSHKTSIISYNFEYFSAPEMQICKDTYVLSWQQMCAPKQEKSVEL